MTTSPRMLLAQARRPRRTLVLGAVPALALLLITPGLPSTAADVDPTTEPAGPTLVADGSFGRVPGLVTTVNGAVPDPAELPVLDAWARPATLTVRPTDGTLSPWRAVAYPEPALDPGTAIDLGTGDGPAVIELERSGLFLASVEGTIRPDGGAVEGTWWWRIAVPDRARPTDDSGPPPPAILLASGDTSISLEQGSGCYVGTCGDIGRVSPPDQLPAIRAPLGAPLALTLADGSGVIRWDASVAFADGSDADAIVLGTAEDTWTSRAWVATPAEGDWVVSVSVTFDRERGYADAYGRLIVGPPVNE